MSVHTLILAEASHHCADCILAWLVLHSPALTIVLGECRVVISERGAQLWDHPTQPSSLHLSLPPRAAHSPSEYS